MEEEEERKVGKSERGGLGSVCVVVGGFKISCS